MNSLARTVKLASIISLIAGIICIFGSVFFIISAPFTVNGYVCLLDSCVLTYLGFTSARTINIPSQAYKIMNQGSVTVVATFVSCAFLMMDRNKVVLEFIIGGICLLLAMFVYVSARRMVVVQKKK